MKLTWTVTGAIINRDLSETPVEQTWAGLTDEEANVQMDTFVAQQMRRRSVFGVNVQATARTRGTHNLISRLQWKEK